MQNDAAELEVLPNDAAELVGVHLRTIFRWIENGHLSSREGRVRLTEVQQIVDALKGSCSKLEARKKLNICCATQRSWKDKGILEFVRVVGTDRVLRSSVDRVLETKKGRRVNFHPDFVPVWDLLKVTGLECGVLNSYIDSGVVRSELVGGKRMIPRDEFERLSSLMSSTLRPRQVMVILSKSKDTVQSWRKSGRLREVEVLGRKRIAVDSIAVTDSEKRLLEIYLDTQRSSNPIEDRKEDGAFRPVRVRELGTVKVFPAKQAAEKLGKPLRFVEELFRKGTLRGRLVDEQLYIIASSLAVYEARVQK